MYCLPSSLPFVLDVVWSTYRPNKTKPTHSFQIFWLSHYYSTCTFLEKPSTNTGEKKETISLTNQLYNKQNLHLQLTKHSLHWHAELKATCTFTSTNSDTQKSIILSAVEVASKHTSTRNGTISTHKETFTSKTAQCCIHISLYLLKDGE